MPTLEEIAKQAGVSRSTVSRVVNEQPNVRDDVRKRVLEVIEITGYHPHAAARALASQRSWMIGLVLPLSVSFFFVDPYYPHLTQGIALACNQNDYTLGLFLIDNKDNEDRIYSRLSRSGNLDGILVQSGHYGDPFIDRLVDSDIPIVFVGRPFHANCFSYIDIDNITAAYNAVSHLIRLGRTRIGTIAGPATSTVGIDRLEGYQKAKIERGHTVDDSLIVEGDFTEASGYYSMQQLLVAKPDAVFVASDHMAVGAMRAVREAGMDIPDDIAFIGFDDLPIAKLPRPQLTTIRQPIMQFGIKAVEILIDLIENGVDPPRHIIMDTELVIRGTCGGLQRNGIR
jgi:LacI family transcriptional regulator